MTENRDDFSFSPGENDRIYKEYMDDIIHQDHIGEYKRETIKIQFDKTSAEVNKTDSKFEENNHISKVDLNELGYNTHNLRYGDHGEKIFYGCKIIENKKVFTLRSQF